jgi:DNA-binding response OmpR family regulator
MKLCSQDGSEAASMTIKRNRILLVEDDKFLRRACEKGLRQQGFDVLTAVDGEQALQMIQSDPPELILLDILMPKVTGIEVLQVLRSGEKTRAIPVLILTNSSKETDAREIEGLGVSGYYVKANLSLEELGSRVRQLLEG